MTTLTWILLTLLALLVVLPMTVYLTTKLARAGWLRGEQAAKNHNHQPQEGESTDG